MGFISYFKRQYFPLNKIELSKENLLWNYKYLSQISGLRIAPVLKSNAYGHGLVQAAKILDNINAPFFCVDSIHEGYQLLKAKIRTPILIMGYIQPENLKIKKLLFSYAVWSYETIEAIKKYQPQAGLHIFVDTAMHREGILFKDLPEFVRIIKKLNLRVEGLMSHFGMADKSNSPETKKQVRNFKKTQETLLSERIFPKYFHIAATSGVLNLKDLRFKIQDLGNICRVGIGLYGIDPKGKNKKLKPVLTLKSTIAQIKELKKGEKVGYDFTFVAKKKMIIAILPVGYNDGVNRKLSNKGFVKIHGKFCPIVGRVSMNITTIDISEIQNIKVGDEVIIYSNNPNDKNCVYNVAKLCGVLPYEILIGLHASTKRVIVNPQVRA